MDSRWEQRTGDSPMPDSRNARGHSKWRIPMWSPNGICKQTLYLGHYTRKAFDKKHEPRHKANRVWNWGVKAQEEQQDTDRMKTSKELGSVVPTAVSRDTGWGKLFFFGLSPCQWLYFPAFCWKLSNLHLQLRTLSLKTWTETNSILWVIFIWLLSQHLIIYLYKRELASSIILYPIVPPMYPSSLNRVTLHC